MQTASAPASISSYIQSLQYDARRLLSLPANGSTETLPNPKASAPNGVIICTRKEKSLQGDLEDIAILNPAAGVVFPGALVLANQNLAEGRPVPIALPRNPVTLRVDLPGLGSQGTLVVENPNQANVATALDKVLEFWNGQPAANGYVNAAKSNLSITKAHSSQQMALDLGFSANWASNQVSSQLRVGNRQESTVYVALFKQVFYTVTMNAPESPASVFGPEVSMSRLQEVIDRDNPPAYVRSVDYGRMILVRMETSSRDTSVNLEGAFSYAMNGGGNLAANVKASYEQVIRNSKFTVVALGGNAGMASRIATPEDVNQLRSIIQDGATYSRSNPGTPISYTVAFLKDNQLARMGYTTNYTEMECRQHSNGFVRFRHSGGYVARWFVTWKETDSQGNYTVPGRWQSGNQTAGYTYQLNLPGDAIDINIKAEAKTGLAWNPWGQIMNIHLEAPNNTGYRVHGTTLNRKWDTNY